ncbi:NUDIX domain-containing protein [Jonesia denitrificans]|uniref:NUDIX hydrolase n=1 Tax=Jonesia denitrificans (strain ATCC 14870 / DSM 20603 / BCRC 15368 / CIP 55.134 / JCM 11481 / NBRC 15587 / NCTC 10816 / Prevot 55134) TaxID=471856 RepID=C7R3T2_JONDD|nr:NUDIX hydrolase [Jonesia denitrificans DSM 20603]AVJ53336.1 NUDIX hydrolase [Jonesia denitrificans]SQH20778.1 ADP-ribose pyrophosphatase [Jonesia denitrificans]
MPDTYVPMTPVADVQEARPVTQREVLVEGRVFDLVRDIVDLGSAGVVTRDYVDHPGAVAIIALNDRDEVLLLRQYRHPVRSFLWEPPAGLLDVAGEDAAQAAARELYEEADLRATSWAVLADYFTTPGGNNEALRVFLARNLTEVPHAEQHERVDEEVGMERAWVPLDEAVSLVLAGDLHNPSAVVGILAAQAARATGWASLRPVDTPWPQRRSRPASLEPLAHQ